MIKVIEILLIGVIDLLLIPLTILQYITILSRQTRRKWHKEDQILKVKEKLETLND